MSIVGFRFDPGHIVMLARTKAEFVIANTPRNVMIESTGAPAYIYMDPTSGQLFVMPQSEMEDGRFVLLR